MARRWPPARCVAEHSWRRCDPICSFVELRGNIQTRLTKVPDDGAIVMAVAAMEILDLTHLVAQVLPIDEFVPAVGQGCVAVECATDDADTLELLAAVDHAATRRAVEIERAFLATLGSGCSLPVGAHVDGDRLRAFLADGDVSLYRSVDLGADLVRRRSMWPRRCSSSSTAPMTVMAGRTAHDDVDPHGLAGVTVVITRPVDQAAALVELFEARGARTIVMPLIEVVDRATPAEVEAALAPADRR